jgi:hypothetical protein
MATVTRTVTFRAHIRERAGVDIAGGEADANSVTTLLQPGGGRTSVPTASFAHAPRVNIDSTA